MREPLLMVATGQKKVGKTYSTTQMFENYVKANPHTGKKARKILIYDVNMEYTQYKAIGLEHLKQYTLQERVEIRRVLPRLEDGSIASIDQMMMIMNKCLTDFAGGLLVLEDINRYLIGTQTQDIIGTIATNRHRDLDIIIHLQSLGAMTPRMWQNTSVIRFHKQQDSIHRYKDRIPYLEQLRIAEFLVNDQYYGGNERFKCFVSGEEGYIRGEFSKPAFRKACEKYASQYSPELKILEKSFKGEPDPRAKAIDQIASELVIKYHR